MIVKLEKVNPYLVKGESDKSMVTINSTIGTYEVTITKKIKPMFRSLDGFYGIDLEQVKNAMEALVTALEGGA